MECLNDAGVKHVFQHLGGEIIKAPFALNAQVISQNLQRFDYNQKCFRDWVIHMKLAALFAFCLRQTFVCRF